MEKQSLAPTFVPAPPGWLALFEVEIDGALTVRAEPVIAWRLGGTSGVDTFHGRAVVGASPWLEKADPEDSDHYFALVREAQLEPAFLAELQRNGAHSRQEILAAAARNRDQRDAGHDSWVRDRRYHRAARAPGADPIRLF